MTDTPGGRGARRLHGVGGYALGVALVLVRWAVVVVAVLVWIVVVPLVEIARAAWARLAARTSSTRFDDGSPHRTGAAAVTQDTVGVHADEDEGGANERLHTLTA